ncbi:MAG: DinB family protein [Phycisphaerae bacterium]
MRPLRAAWCDIVLAAPYAATVALHTSDHGPFSPRVLTWQVAESVHPRCTATIRARTIKVMTTPSSTSASIVALQRTLRFHLEFARRLVGDLAPEQMTAVPGPGHENHPAFTIGHLVTGLDLIAQDIGLASDLPSGWGELFLRRGPADRRVPPIDAQFPSRAELLSELERQAARVAESLNRIDEAWLAARSEPWKLSEYLPTNHDGVLFMACAHQSMHLGQLASWRRAMNLPAAMAQM